MTSQEPARQDLYPVAIGDEVLFRADEKWTSAEVLAIHSTGELALHYEVGVELVRQRSTHGNHLYGWLTYEEAAMGATQEVASTEP